MANKKDKRRKRNEPDKATVKRRRAAVLKTINISETYGDVTTWSTRLQKDLKGAKPFPHWQLDNFIENSSNIVEEIENELQNFPDWHRKENDLYSLYQTDDFKSLNAERNPALFSLREFLYGPVKDWLSKVTGVELLPQVDINGSCYSHTDGLLPHNDLIDTRRFAFVYYVTPFLWEESNGGVLNLYNSDEHDQPTSVAVQLSPRRNSFLIFEVTHKSWHRVMEILGKEDPRLSVNGWFHSSRRLEAKSAPLVRVDKVKQIEITEKLNTYISPTYLDKDKSSQIQDMFGESSEVSLKEFLQGNLASTLLKELNSGTFVEMGPPSKRNVYRCSLQKIGNCCKNFANALKSTKMADYCSSITGCTLNDCQVSLSVYRIQHGTYSVVGDEDAENAMKEGYSLDVHLFLGDDISSDNAGGETIYIGQDDEEPLIEICPESNTLALVLRDPEVFSFQKYANSLTKRTFYQFTLIYHDVPIEPEE